jgi:hypothetical protein
VISVLCRPHATVHTQPAQVHNALTPHSPTMLHIHHCAAHSGEHEPWIAVWPVHAGNTSQALGLLNWIAFMLCAGLHHRQLHPQQLIAVPRMYQEPSPPGSTCCWELLLPLLYTHWQACCATPRVTLLALHLTQVGHCALHRQAVLLFAPMQRVVQVTAACNMHCTIIYMSHHC